MIIYNKYVLFLILSLLNMVEAASYVPAFQVTDKFIETGTYALNEQYYFYGNASWDSYQSLEFEIVFNRSFPDGSQYHHSFQELHIKITPQNEINITIVRADFRNTHEVIALRSKQIMYIRYIRIRYIVIQLPFDQLPFITVTAKGIDLLISPNLPFDHILTISYDIHYTEMTQAICFFQGMDIVSSDDNRQFSLAAQCSFISSNELNVKITTDVSRYITFKSASLSLIVYNEQANSWSAPGVSIEIVKFTGSNGIMIYLFNEEGVAKDYNTFWGLTHFNAEYGAGMLHFTSDLQSQAIYAKSDYPFISLDFVVMLFKFKWCDASYPYYLFVDATCYDLCPARFYEEQTQLVCNLCMNYDCYKCLPNGTCTECNSDNFRVLNEGRCVAMEGYFDDGTNSPLAKLCNPNCKACIASAAQCTICFSGSFLNSSKNCQPCAENCEVCTNTTICTKCNALSSLNASNSCEISINCSLITNCILCNVTKGCMQCSIGYNLINLASCVSVCGDGVKLSFENCDDNNSNSTDGCKNCQVNDGFYCNNTALGKSSCDMCKLHCGLCSSSADCFSCQPPYLLQNGTMDCVPNCSHIVHCVNCRESISSNQTICDSCILGYEVVKSTCQPKCGDGIIISPEECDDNNTLDNDGCNYFCQFENKSICNTCKNIAILPQRQDFLFNIMITLIILSAISIPILFFIYRKLHRQNTIISEHNPSNLQSSQVLST